MKRNSDSYSIACPVFRFIHLATHGTPNAVEPLESAIILLAGAGGRFKLPGQDIITTVCISMLIW